MDFSKRIGIRVLLSLWFGLGLFPRSAAEDPPKAGREKPAHRFIIDTEVKRTAVRDQYRSNTCWDFATLSFIESELIRLGRGEFDLSEMFVVRSAYPLKARQYVRNHGAANFDQGGQSHDVLDVIRRCGIVPEAAYPGLIAGEKRHNHGELIAVLKGMLDGVLKMEKRRISTCWPDAVEAVLDVYLGRAPDRFSLGGKTYSPRTFADEALRLNPDEYVELTSYSCYPFYRKCRLEVPDNWSQNDDYLNLPIDDLESVIDHALKTGYSVVWDGDVSEREFLAGRTGYAVVPMRDWEERSRAERDEKIDGPEAEREISQGLRDQTFADFSTADDHLMHIVGLAHDQKGTKFYLAKNSYGADQPYGGYAYLSRSYVRLKTVAVTVHKNSLPAGVAGKLGIVR